MDLTANRARLGVIISRAQCFGILQATEESAAAPRLTGIFQTAAGVTASESAITKQKSGDISA